MVGVLEDFDIRNEDQQISSSLNTAIERIYHGADKREFSAVVSKLLHEEAVNPGFGSGNISDGLIIAPLYIGDEALTGLLMIRCANKLPYVSCRYQDAQHESIKDEEVIENGIIHCLRSVSSSIGMGIVNARVNEAIRTLKAFSVQNKVLEKLSVMEGSVSESNNSMTTKIVSLLLLRLLFRLTASCFPYIRQLTIWEIKLSPMSVNDNVVKGYKQVDWKNFMDFMRPSKSPSDYYDENSGENTAGLKNRKYQIFENNLLSGYFLSEDPIVLLRTDSESDLVDLDIEQFLSKKDISLILTTPRLVRNGGSGRYQNSESGLNSKLIYNEIVKSIELFHKSFHLSSGHFLVSVESESALYTQILELFNDSKSSHISNGFVNYTEKPPLPKVSRGTPKYSSDGSVSEIEQKYYFFSLLAAGVGDHDGWGDIGEYTEKSLLEIFESLRIVSERLFT